MTSPSILRALATCALVAIAARPSSAQSTAQAGMPAATSDATGTPWAAVPVGKYQLAIQLPDHVMSGMLTIRDSSGVPAAVFLGQDDPEAHPMRVTVKGTELFLNAEAPNGAIEIVLVRKGDQLDGHWSFGEGKGTLTGKAEK